jgi:hypothetical protein
VKGLGFKPEKCTSPGYTTCALDSSRTLTLGRSGGKGLGFRVLVLGLRVEGLGLRV